MVANYNPSAATTTINMAFLDVIRILSSFTDPNLNSSIINHKIRRQAIKAIDWNELIKNPPEALLSIGFERWDDSSDLFLVPPWLFEAIPNDFILKVPNSAGCKKSELMPGCNTCAFMYKNEVK